LVSWRIVTGRSQGGIASAASSIAKVIESKRRSGRPETDRSASEASAPCR
jgi:hypothetical protein